MEEQRCAGSGPCLCELLRRQHAEREPRVDEIDGQFVGDADTALAHLVEPGLFDVGETLVDALERASPEQVRCVYGVPGLPKVVGERADTGGQPLCVMKQQDLSHRAPPGGMEGNMQQRVIRFTQRLAQPHTDTQGRGPTTALR